MIAVEANVLLTRAALIDPRMKRNDPVEQADMAEAWAEVLADVAPADAARAMREHYATETRPLMPADVRAILGLGPLQRDSIPSIDAEVLAASKARVLAAAGVTAEEYAAHEHDFEWVRARFGPVLQLDAPTHPFDENGEPE